MNLLGPLHPLHLSRVAHRILRVPSNALPACSAARYPHGVVTHGGATALRCLHLSRSLRCPHRRPALRQMPSARQNRPALPYALTLFSRPAAHSACAERFVRRVISFPGEKPPSFGNCARALMGSPKADGSQWCGRSFPTARSVTPFGQQSGVTDMGHAACHWATAL